jgi:hypothetical protein
MIDEGNFNVKNYCREDWKSRKWCGGEKVKMKML